MSSEEVKEIICEITTKYGSKGILVGDCHVMFENDSYSHTVPIKDITDITIIKKEE